MRRWTKLRSRAQSLLCESLKDRVEFRVTKYRNAGDDHGRASITLDKKEIYSSADIDYWVTRNALSLDLAEMNSYGDDANRIPGVRNRAWSQAEEILERSADRGVGGLWIALEAYLRTEYPQLQEHSDELIAALAMFDRRLGKRKLIEMRDLRDKKRPLVKKFLQIRLEADGIA